MEMTCRIRMKSLVDVETLTVQFNWVRKVITYNNVYCTTVQPNSLFKTESSGAGEQLL